MENNKRIPDKRDILVSTRAPRVRQEEEPCRGRDRVAQS